MTPGERTASKILSFAQYGLLRHSVPYVVRADRPGSQLLLVGVRHSTDPADPMFEQIESHFGSLAPALALHEGTPPHVESEREINIRRHGEAGLLRFLAARAGIETASVDLPLAHEARCLRQCLTIGEVLVFMVLRQLASYNRKTLPPDFKLYFDDFFAIIAPALDFERIEWADVESQHRRILGSSLDRASVSPMETNPLRYELPTQRIARLSNRLRDEHMLRILRQARRERTPVFAVIGVAHAVMLEPALLQADGDTGS